MERFIEDYFKGEVFSKINIERTPLGLRIVINTSRPGRIIGSGGRKINELADRLKERFKIENPQVDVKSIKNPDVDATIVAKQIALALESGNNYKKIGNLFVKKIMDAGALGVEIIISGKMGGSKGRTEKFSTGYLKYCGDTAERLVDTGFSEALVKLGKIGIQVRIMRYFMDTFGNILTKKDLLERGLNPEEKVPGIAAEEDVAIEGNAENEEVKVDDDDSNKNEKISDAKKDNDKEQQD
ncbi:MAG: 30S ribosomal protein S3 [Candidatus Micrarchaeota archaeon]|nr:30S ribosomal protein S3 [Candidatus Micrarchaeota archaeon]